MGRSRRFSAEVRERAVRMVLEHQDEYGSQWETIGSVAALYSEGIIQKPDGYPSNYPFLLSFMHTNGSAWNEDLDGLSYIDQVLLQIHMKHRMRSNQAFFHVYPDYAYWYGWNEMTKDLGEIKELARNLRASHTTGE